MPIRHKKCIGQNNSGSVGRPDTVSSVLMSCVCSPLTQKKKKPCNKHRVITVSRGSTCGYIAKIRNTNKYIYTRHKERKRIKLVDRCMCMYTAVYILQADVGKIPFEKSLKRDTAHKQTRQVTFGFFLNDIASTYIYTYLYFFETLFANSHTIKRKEV